jgi:hypothetical protein
MITKPATIDELLDYWPGNIPFKWKLVSDDGSCMCAQGQALHFLGGYTVNELRDINQRDADLQVARIFGISLAHSILLRSINDTQDGAPTCVIRNPEQVLGDQAQTVLAFWRHLDRMTPADREAVREAVREAALAAVMGAAREAALAAAGAAVGVGAGAAVGVGAVAVAVAGAGAVAGAWAAAPTTTWAAVGATHEIQGAAVIRAKNQPFVFLPLFGFSDPESVIASSI